MSKGAAELTASCSVTCLLFPFLSFRLFRFALSLPFPELPLAFFAFIVGENIREDAPGNVFNLVLRNTGIGDCLFYGSSRSFPPVRHEIFKVQLCVDDLYLKHSSLLKMENADTCQAAA